MTKEIPILFSTPMVQAELEGRKTQTRRIIKSRHESGLFTVSRRVSDGQITNICSLDWNERNCDKDIICPYGKPGDILWVKETFTILDWWEDSKAVQVMYEDGKTLVGQLTEREWLKFKKWKQKEGRKSSLFMFKSLSRIWLKVTNVRVERLQDISEEDAITEGVDFRYDKDEYGLVIYDGKAKRMFEELWQSINGPESWDLNPYVWVVEFEVLSTTGKPENI